MAFAAIGPPPNRYDLPALFRNKGLKGRSYTFGIAREAYAKVYLKENTNGDGCAPGPGTYNVRPNPGKDASKYSFRPKTSNFSI
jgi:hypothetical protein